MKTCLRIATLFLAAAGGLATAPTRGADATLNGAERWRLRPTREQTTGSIPVRAERSIPLSDLPGERRQVRIVYPGYREGQGAGAAR